MKTSPIRLSFQCDQNWDEMPATAKGRFCQQCSREVIDFSASSREEVYQQLQQAKGKTCGRFRGDQIDPIIISEIFTPSWFRRAIAVVSMGLIATTTPILAQRVHVVKPVVTYEQSVSLMPDHVKPTPPEPSPETDTVPILNGRVGGVNIHEKVLISTRRRILFLTRRFPFFRYEKYPRTSIGVPKF